MTRADKIKAYVKERYGVEINERSLEETVFRFQHCDGFECHPECMHEDCSPPECDKCKYNNFWEQEDKEPQDRTPDAEFFKWRCPYTNILCFNWHCEVCQVEENERKFIESIKKEESDVLPNC